MFDIKEYESRGYRKARRKADHFTHNLLTRLFIFNRDGNKCLKCGATENLTIDHTVAVCRGGGNEFSNLQTLCRSCNSGKTI